MRYFKIEDGNVVESDQVECYSVETIDRDTAIKMSLKSFDGVEDETLSFPEKCSCTEGMGGCKETISMTCTPDNVHVCIKELVANCKR